MNSRQLLRALLFLLTLIMNATALAQPQWRLAPGTAGFPISAIDIYRSNPDTMYALGEKLFRSTNNGDSWDTVATHILSSGSLEALRVDPFDARLLYVSHWGLGGSNDVHMSTNGGLTWRFLFSGASIPTDVVELNPRDHRTVYVSEGPSSIWRSTDQGNQWSRLPYGPTALPYSLVIDPTNDSILYTGHQFGAVLKSTDWGMTWQYSMNRQAGGMTRLAINPVDPRIIYASVAYIGSTDGGVFKTTDGGGTWAEANNGLGSENRTISAIAINPANPLELFLGKGVPTIVFRTTNGGGLWVPSNSGLPTTSAHTECIAFDTLNNKVFVGISSSTGSGLYVWDRATSVEISTGDMPTSFRLYQNYPNPFNPLTSIRFQIPKSDHVSLKVFDILGRKVATLVDEQRDAGNYEEVFDASRLASGVFFYRLQSANLTDVKKLVVLR